MQHTEITKDHSKYHRTKTAANQTLQQVFQERNLVAGKEPGNTQFLNIIISKII